MRPEATGPSFGEFTFARTIYDSPYGSYRRRGMWAVDFPEADNNLIVGLREWAGTNLKIAPRPEQVPIMDDKLFDYPMIYFVEPGFLELSDEQAARLREYVARGGFMFFDDFWGDYEWENLETQLHKIWPDRQAKDLPLSHPVFHSYLDIDEIVQVPNIMNARRGGDTSEKGGIVPTTAELKTRTAGWLFSFPSTAISATPGNGSTIPAIPRNTDCLPTRRRSM